MGVGRYRSTGRSLAFSRIFLIWDIWSEPTDLNAIENTIARFQETLGSTFAFRCGSGAERSPKLHSNELITFVKIFLQKIAFRLTIITELKCELWNHKSNKALQLWRIRRVEGPFLLSNRNLFRTKGGEK